jgi:hypothetical protein
VKGTLFLTIGVAATVSGRRLWLVLLLAAVLALSLGGLPLTGGALAKLAIKARLGNGIASTAAAVSAPGTTLFMLHFLLRLARSRDARAAASAGLVWSWLVVALASVVIPWLIYPALGGDIADALTPAALLEALWPVLIGAALVPGLRLWGDRLPRTGRGHHHKGGGCLPRELRFRCRVGTNGCPAPAVARGGSFTSGGGSYFGCGGGIQSIDALRIRSRSNPANGKRKRSPFNP